MGCQVKRAICRSLRRGGGISIVSAVFESATKMSVFLTKYSIATTHLIHCFPLCLQCLYTHDNVCFVFWALFLGIFQLLFEVFQGFTIAFCLRKKQQNSGSHSDQINKVVGAVMFYDLDVDVLLRFIVRVADKV